VFGAAATGCVVNFPYHAIIERAAQSVAVAKR
jgi:hypothetical protein